MKTMKHIGIFSLFIFTFSNAQIMVVSQNKVVFESVAEYLELSEKYWDPIFDKLVDDGKLNEVGTLSHYWGDEWNIVAYYKAKDTPSFENAWSEGYREWVKETPKEVRDNLSKMILEHKDSIYQLKHSYNGK